MLLLQACAAPGPPEPALWSLDRSGLPVADVTARVAGLGPCTDSPDRTLHLNARSPVTVLVHGCFGSTGQFRGLAQVLAFQGQQSACFTYDDRAGLDASAAALATAIGELASLVDGPAAAPQITLIGHSQGALIARRALTAGQAGPAIRDDARLRLVTISGPFSGIAAADACGSPVVRQFSLGLIAPLCRLATGDKWSDITYSSTFIREPGALAAQVKSYLKIDTDERGSCRRAVDGRCVEDDLVFSLAEQRHPDVDRDPATRVLEVRAGHVEIVGDQRVAPVKLLAILQEYGILAPPAPGRATAYANLLAAVYGDPAFAPVGRRPSSGPSAPPP